MLLYTRSIPVSGYALSVAVEFRPRARLRRGLETPRAKGMFQGRALMRPREVSPFCGDQMPRPTIGWCLNCGHKVAPHSKHADWRHVGVGQGYLLSVNCIVYDGSTNTLFDRGAFR